MVLASTALETATAELAPKLAIRAEAAMVRTMSLRMASLPWADRHRGRSMCPPHLACLSRNCRQDTCDPRHSEIEKFD